MNIPDDLKYTKEHEWARVEGDIAVIGISEYAQGELGDIVFIEFPAPGDATQQMQPCASIEAVKAVSDMYAPVSGEVVAANDALPDSLETLSEDPYGRGWLLLIEPTRLEDELKQLVRVEP